MRKSQGGPGSSAPTAYGHSASHGCRKEVWGMYRNVPLSSPKPGPNLVRPCLVAPDGQYTRGERGRMAAALGHRYGDKRGGRGRAAWARPCRRAVRAQAGRPPVNGHDQTLAPGASRPSLAGRDHRRPVARKRHAADGALREGSGATITGTTGNTCGGWPCPVLDGGLRSGQKTAQRDVGNAGTVSASPHARRRT